MELEPVNEGGPTNGRRPIEQSYFWPDNSRARPTPDDRRSGERTIARPSLSTDRKGAFIAPFQADIRATSRNRTMPVRPRLENQTVGIRARCRITERASRIVLQ